MNLQINIRTAYRTVVVVIALLLIMSVSRWHIISRPYTTRSEEISADRNYILEGDSELTQLIGAEGERLRRVDLLIADARLNSHIDFFLCDEEQNMLLSRSKVITARDIERGYVHFDIGFDLERGGSYYIKYSIPKIEDWREPELVEEYRGSKIECRLEDHALTTATANSYLVANGEEWEEYNLIQRYHYSIHFNWWQSLALIIVIIVAELVVLIKLDRMQWNSQTTTLQSVLRIVLNPFIIIGTIILLIMVYPCKVFGSIWYNILFWDVSIVMATGLLLYILNYKREGGLYNIEVWKVIKCKLPNIARTICIAGMLWQAFQYVNGLYNIHHIYAYRRALIWFILLIMTTYNKNELCRWINLIWVAVGSGIGIYRFNQLAIDEEKVITYKLETYIIILGGIVILNLCIKIKDIIKYKSNKGISLNWVFLAPFIVFLAGTMILSHTREWPFYLSFICLILGLRLLFWSDRDRFTLDVCNGVTLNYIIMGIYSLMHRPYYKYRAHRYPLGFHTVTVTAVYMTMVLAVLGVRLFYKHRYCKDRRGLIPEVLLFGSACNYMLFTLSRTGYLSVLIMLIVTLCLIAFVYDDVKERIVNTCRRIGFIIIIMALSFPITFTATRLVPSVVDDPIVYDYEHNDITMYRGTAKDNENYMDIYRFGQVFASKILGVGTTITDASEYNSHRYNLDVINNSLLASADRLESIWMLLSSSETNYDNDMDQFSNGRMTIFKCYLQQSNLWGHDSMGAILPGGEEATHAHNTFLQAIYDHGWVFGIYFALFLVYAWIISVIRLYKHKEIEYTLALPVMLCGLMSAGLVEWVFHPCFPICMAMILLMVPMIYRDGEILHE